MIYINRFNFTQYRKSKAHNYAEYLTRDSAWRLSASVTNNDLDNDDKFKGE